MDANRGIRKIEIEGEAIYIKNSKIFGWSIVHPLKIDGSWNFKNLITGGSWIKFFLMVLLILIIIGAVSEYANTLEIANKCLSQTQWINLP